MSHVPLSGNKSRTAAEDGRTADVGPTGLTYREKQRRRIVIAGLTAPTLMTLPGRRAWSAACSKSKLKKISGNLSAKKQVFANCDNIACKYTFWKDPMQWPMITGSGAPQPGDPFDMYFPSPMGYGPMYSDSPSLIDVLNKDGTIVEEDSAGNETAYKEVGKGAIEDFNQQAAAALLNAYYLNNMNFVVGFWYPGTDMPIMPAHVLSEYTTYLLASLVAGDDAQVKAGKDYFKNLNEQPGGCPIK